ncbi:carbohydrate ABC transporter permease [Paenibacillus pasadenensis]|uniref:carbohydrate ABC transporter permease n=1 Tax=Paenibacillus pasadenensis TaxID=217090 RepID=UPI00203D81C4|nr:carbohydrate ABC transporter permease [Paenibacillus pasadenensis]MCM3748701.1 carbohydrate ABC transporter permease [Paenibacillus pasadenensis]
MVRGLSDRIFDIFLYAILTAVALLSVIPMVYVVSISLTPYTEVLKNGGFILFPKSITFEAYRQLFSNNQIPRALFVTIFITVVGTAINIILTVLMAYPLSRKKLRGRSIFLMVIVFTMLFSGGLIPTYLVVKATGMTNTLWAMIVPSAIWTFNVLILKSFYESLPEDLFESARIDGAGEWRVLAGIVLPLSVPAMLTVGLFYTVGHWNDFFQAILYITNTDLHPLQVLVRNLLLESQNMNNQSDVILPTVTLQMAAVVSASLPILAVYPFIQKHFTKGVLVGAIKG